MDAIDLDDLVADWTLVGDELELVAGKRGPTRLGFALLLKFYGRYGSFITDSSDLDADVVDYVARQISIEPGVLEGYDWSSRAVRFHRRAIREHFGFRECSTADADRGVDWLVTNVCERERSTAVVRDELLAWFRREGVEPPAAARVERLVRSALHRGELALTSRVASRLPAAVRARLDDLIAHPDDADDVRFDDVSAWSAMLAEPGDVSLNTMLVEIDKLNAVRFVQIPGGLLGDVSPGVVERWRKRLRWSHRRICGRILMSCAGRCWRRCWWCASANSSTCWLIC